jgi:hypothetical protein
VDANSITQNISFRNKMFQNRIKNAALACGKAARGAKRKNEPISARFYWFARRRFFYNFS